MPFEGVPQTEKEPSTSQMPTMRRPAAEVKHPKSFEELAAEAATRNQRAAAMAAAEKMKTAEAWNAEPDTERPISPFDELKEEERQKDIELMAQIRERFEQEGYDRDVAFGLATEELERLKKEKEAKELAEFNAHELKKAENRRKEIELGKEQELAVQQVSRAQIIARQAATGTRLLPHYNMDDQQAA